MKQKKMVASAKIHANDDSFDASKCVIESKGRVESSQHTNFPLKPQSMRLPKDLQARVATTHRALTPHGLHSLQESSKTAMQGASFSHSCAGKQMDINSLPQPESPMSIFKDLAAQSMPPSPCATTSLCMLKIPDREVSLCPEIERPFLYWAAYEIAVHNATLYPLMVLVQSSLNCRQWSGFSLGMTMFSAASAPVFQEPAWQPIDSGERVIIRCGAYENLVIVAYKVNDDDDVYLYGSVRVKSGELYNISNEKIEEKCVQKIPAAQFCKYVVSTMLPGIEKLD